jgi:hypothetical protein
LASMVTTMFPKVNAYTYPNTALPARVETVPLHELRFRSRYTHADAHWLLVLPDNAERYLQDFSAMTYSRRGPPALPAYILARTDMNPVPTNRLPILSGNPSHAPVDTGFLSPLVVPAHYEGSVFAPSLEVLPTTHCVAVYVVKFYVIPGQYNKREEKSSAQFNFDTPYKRRA